MDKKSTQRIGTEELHGKKSVRFVFSLVLYKHEIDDIAPLLKSIVEINKYCRDIRFSVVIYDAHRAIDPKDFEEQIRRLLEGLPVIYRCGNNIGFARANNVNANSLIYESEEYFVVSNPDISFVSTELAPLLYWMIRKKNISCAVPLIINPGGIIQCSVKKDPTLLSLLLGRIKYLRTLPILKRYDAWHRNLGADYSKEIISSSYLSGCFLIIPSVYYARVGGFSEQYFLHLEDADIVRRLSAVGWALHNPLGRVYHQWARGSHKSIHQTIYLLQSVIIYMRAWGWKIW